MLNTTYKGRNGSYTTTRELGKGGEGTVYELAGEPDKVLKIYSDLQKPIKVRKLEIMATLADTKVKEYAAWPLDTVTDERSNMAGFVMKKLANYRPLHMLFSPMDRKKTFPDKGYNFLVHVAKNLATAFHILHSAGLVVGDVNEGNVLVNKQGMVAFIDCDSFQMRNGEDYFYCEVGVPRYTPPEVLERSSFHNLVRTENTDSFSLGILIFQLLFLGRHPFAGRNISNEDIDEETAIRKHLFAFSLHQPKKKLLPPVDSFEIKNLPAGLVELFHLTFENRIARPLPQQWVGALHDLLQNMTVCSHTKLHTYPSQLTQCPWCIFRDQRNILYFLDEGLLQNLSSLQDMETFVQGFRIEKLQFVPMSVQSLPYRQITPNPIEKKYFYYKTYNGFAIAGLIIVALVLALVLMATGLALVGGIISIGFSFIRKLFPWRRQLGEELYRRSIDKTNKMNELEVAVESYNYSPEAAAYSDTGNRLERLIQRYKKLPAEIQNGRKGAEDKVYYEQITQFLQTFSIQDGHIAGFGASRKQSLYTAGIYTAADISKLNNFKVQGIGDKYIQTLLSWQRQVSTLFVYHPDVILLNTAYQQIQTAAEAKKSKLEEEIKHEYQTLQHIKMNFPIRQERLMKNIQQRHDVYLQAEADYDAFLHIS